MVYAKNFSGPPAPNPVLFDGKPKDIVLDMAGNIYTSGNFKGTADFNPGPGTYTLTSAFGDDVFISKFDPGGSLIWQKILKVLLIDQTPYGACIGCIRKCIYLWENRWYN